jgi:hypothetical protein
MKLPIQIFLLLFSVSSCGQAGKTCCFSRAPVSCSINSDKKYQANIFDTNYRTVVRVGQLLLPGTQLFY